MAPIRHQQIPEGHAFVEPRNPDTARALLEAAESLDLEAGVVRTQQGGYIAPTEVVEKYQATVGDDAGEVTTSEQLAEAQAAEAKTAEAGDDVPAKSASKGDWVAYAASQGYDESEGLTKDELIERYGAAE